MNDYQFWLLGEYANMVTPVLIGGLGFLIAIRQWRTASHKVKLDVFDKRYAIYWLTHKFFMRALGHGDVTDVIASDFRIETSAASFLFGKEIPKYLDEIRDMVDAINYTKAMQKDRHDFPRDDGDQELNALTVKREAQEQQLADLSHQLDKKFHRYLDTSNL